MRISNAILCGVALTSFTTAHSATVTVSATAPTINGADIANLSGTADAGGDQGHVWSNRPLQGQTFTTGANAGGYTLSSITLQNLNNTIATAPTFNLLIGTVSGTVITQIGATETAVAPAYIPLDYITFAFTTPVALAPNTQYGYLWGTSASGFVTTNNTNDATYSGGTAISSGANGTADLNNVLTRGVDRVFHADIVAVPEPATSMLAFLGGLLLLGRRRK